VCHAPSFFLSFSSLKSLAAFSLPYDGELELSLPVLQIQVDVGEERKNLHPSSAVASHVVILSLGMKDSLAFKFRFPRSVNDSVA